MNENIAARDLRIVHYTDKHIVDPRGKSELPEREYQTARNEILEVYRRFGTIGPMDSWPVAGGLSEREIWALWKASPENNPDFYVLDDQLNYERYIYIEIGNRNALSEGWMSCISSKLKELDGWGVGITNIRNGYLILLNSAVLVNGPVFAECKDLNCVVDACREHLY